ncbi:MAG TPA: DNA-formamidopyrimidine glycosylase family protein [Thermoanaerobaculia bacterium]|nr:DNA-formamidopyrimidine glycosylase family protein [Thermoanaerobaculia bacterium]
MPEGDIIFRIARTLDRALSGKIVTRFETALPKLQRASIRGRTIQRVRSVGKHLIIDFSDGLLLRTHLGMNGSWHLYRSGERWRRRHEDMRVVIATDDFEAVGFNIPVAELNSVPTLGPDLLGESFDSDEAVTRMRVHGSREIADVLLDQHVVAGIGNIYKSEVLYACGINPFTRADALTEDALRRMVRKARAMLQRSTRSQVYGRGGQPCRRCGSRIEYRKQGPDVRGTYWCPKCQPLRPNRVPDTITPC